MLVEPVIIVLFFDKQKTAYEMRISDWSSDVCSSDLGQRAGGRRRCVQARVAGQFSHSSEWSRCGTRCAATASRSDRKSVVWEKSVSVCVDLGGRRSIKKKIDKLHALC